MPEALPVSLRFKSLECTQLANKWILCWKELDVSIKVTLAVLKMGSDHLSPATDFSSVQHGGPNGWWCIRYQDRVIPLDNNHGILSSQWLHLPQMPLQRLGNFPCSGSSCNGPGIDFLEERWELATVETLEMFTWWEKLQQCTTCCCDLQLLRKCSWFCNSDCKN